MSDYLVHHGILGMKWGVRRYQNEDGSLTSAGQQRYGDSGNNPGPRKAPAASNGGINPRPQLPKHTAFDGTKSGPTKAEQQAERRLQRRERRLQRDVKRGEILSKEGKTRGKEFGKAVARNALILAGGTTLSVFAGGDNKTMNLINLGTTAALAISTAAWSTNSRSLIAYQKSKAKS